MFNFFKIVLSNFKIRQVKSVEEKKLSLINVLNFPDEKLSEDAKLIKNYFIRLIRGLPNNVYWVDKNGVTLGCNDNVLRFVGVNRLEDVVGKNYEEISKIAGWTAEQGMSFKRDDQEVIKTGKPKINVIEPIFYDKNGKEIHYMSSRIPLFDDDGSLVGIAGISIDIGDRIEKERLEIENEAHKTLLVEQEKFTKIVAQVAHDIRSPLASLLMIMKSCTNIPEPERVAIREAALSIGDIANNLLSKYRKKDADVEGISELLLVSTTLLQLLADKKYQYQEFPVKFDHEFNQEGNFAFIKIESIAFKRSISNIINNAVDAFDGKEGKVIVKLNSTDEWVKIIIEDNGKGMPKEIINKIMGSVAVTEGKTEGHGIGLTQVRETVQRNQGSLLIESEVGKGTQIILTFPRAVAPVWIAEKIAIGPQDIVVILDDDKSIHGAWETHFEFILKSYPKIQLKHFEIGKRALDFIKALSFEDKQKLFLLTDYELLKQELNGLHVIEQSKAERSVLVTSHYANSIVQEQAAKIRTKILPKQLASEVPIEVIDNVKYEYADTRDQLKKVDLVVVDDNFNFIQALKISILEGKIVDHYLDPHHFLENVSKYPKDTKICLDNNFATGDFKGIGVAKKLHDLGYTHIYLLSGEYFKSGDVPSYLTVIMKDDIDRLKEI